MCGPLLFLVFFNDIVRSSCGSKFISFADDSSVFISDKSPTSLTSRTNDMLTSGKTWLVRNRLTSNESKTQYVVFHRKPRAKLCLNIVYLGGNAIKCVWVLTLMIT